MVVVSVLFVHEGKQRDEKQRGRVDWLERRRESARAQETRIQNDDNNEMEHETKNKKIQTRV